jgi:hypothetical protein
LGGEIRGHEVSSILHLGWAELKNGALLEAMAGRFDALVTVDRSVPYQQRPHDHTFAVVLLRATSNRLVDLLPVVPALLRALDEVKPGELREIRA